jgi:glucokinase
LPARDGRSIAAMPGRLAGLEGLNWQDWLEVNTPVPVLNDAQAALLGESWLGAAKGTLNVALLTLGTGVGGAAIVDGHLLRGHIGRAGHLGHVSLNPDGPPDVVGTPGSLEDAIGDHNVKIRSDGEFNSTRQLVDAFRAGSPQAAVVWLRSIRALAAALTGYINVLDPEIILLGGGIADADDALFDPLAAELARFEWRPGGARVRILKAALGPKAGVTGAAYAAKLAATNPSTTSSPLNVSNP